MADEQTPLVGGGTPASSSGASSDRVGHTDLVGYAGHTRRPTTGTATPTATDIVRVVSEDDDSAASPSKWLARLRTPATLVLLAGFIISLSFSFTQVSIFYVFRIMECDVFYTNHPPYVGNGDRCSRNEIDAGTATQFSILAMSTTFFGTWNLFVSGHQIKKWGPRAALVFQTSIPAVRVATQIIGVAAGGQAGIWIIQLTQAITILGGPAGYILVVNTIASEVVSPVERTSLFGKLQGCIMLGVAIGYLIGGIVGDTFGIIRPFQTAFFLFCCASLYARIAMPYLSPESLAGSTSTAAQASHPSGLAAFFEPLKVILPQSLRLHSGRVTNHYGIFYLCCGVFFGVLATGYAPVLLQMYATAVFSFDQAQNGWLLSGNAFMRAVFLIFIFPHIIDSGRAWFARRSRRTTDGSEAPPSSDPEMGGDDVTSDDDIIPTAPTLFEMPPSGTQGEEEPLLPSHHEDLRNRLVGRQIDEEKAAYAFDLFFMRWSLLVDGVITAGAALATQSWHLYLVTLLLPFGSGSAPAAKGVITSMCLGSQRTDALNAITLVENMARLGTLGLFGFVYSALATVGQAHLTFYCNGAVAVVAMLVLMLSHFPPHDSTLIEAEGTVAANEQA